MSKYLVTGGSGFIGRHLIQALDAAGHSVVTLDRRPLPDGAMGNAAQVFVGDVTDPRLLVEAMRGCDGIFHLADVTSGPFRGNLLSRSQETNVTGAIMLLEASAKAGGIPMVYASSAAVYGTGGETRLKESDPPAPVSAYGTAKLCLELYARTAGFTYGVPTMGLRIFNTYGPGQDVRSGYAGVIPVFIEAAKTGADLVVHGTGDQVRDFVHVDDVVRMFQRAIQRTDVSGPVVNVCTGEGISVKALAGRIVALSGSSAPVIPGEKRHTEVINLVGDTTSCAKILGMTAETSLEQGLAAMTGTGAPIRNQ